MAIIEAIIEAVMEAIVEAIVGLISASRHPYVNNASSVWGVD